MPVLLQRLLHTPPPFHLPLLWHRKAAPERWSLLKNVVHIMKGKFNSSANQGFFLFLFDKSKSDNGNQTKVKGSGKLNVTYGQS